jgi:hypothetical protein
VDDRGLEKVQQKGNGFVPVLPASEMYQSRENDERRGWIGEGGINIDVRGGYTLAIKF